jgi:nucleotide-binding universal stress UspA family protein
MYHRLLVPLDGSPFAEQALPLALGIAGRAGASLRLVRVHVLYALQEPAASWGPYDPEMERLCQDQEQSYLDGVVQRLARVSAVPVTADVVQGPAGDAILEEARACKAALVVMTTHGRGPLTRLWLGSVADELARRATVPVLLLRPQEGIPGPPQSAAFSHGLIPLDGTPLAERMLEPALELGRLTGARYTLLRVVVPSLFAGHDPTLDSPTGGGEAMLARRQREAQEYVGAVASRLRGQGFPVEACVVTAFHPATAILDKARRVGADLIALTTRGHRGIKRWLLGSVADKVVRGATTPVLVHHATAEPPA